MMAKAKTPQKPAPTLDEAALAYCWRRSIIDGRLGAGRPPCNIRGIDYNLVSDAMVHHHSKEIHMTYKVVRRVAVPGLSMAAAGEYFFEMGTIVEKPSREDPTKPICVARVKDLTSGEDGEIVLGKILVDIFTESYPHDSYVGKRFRIEKRPSGKASKGGREYNLFYVDEIE